MKSKQGNENTFLLATVHLPVDTAACLSSFPTNTEMLEELPLISNKGNHFVFYAGIIRKIVVLNFQFYFQLGYEIPVVLP